MQKIKEIAGNKKVRVSLITLVVAVALVLFGLELTEQEERTLVERVTDISCAIVSCEDETQPVQPGI